MRYQVRNIIFFLIFNIVFFAVLEIFFTTFFIFHSSNYYGPFTQILLKSTLEEEKVNVYEFRWNKLTQKLYPGTYKYNNEFEFKVNSLGFLGEEFSIENKKNCRIISFGGSTTAGVESGRPYPKILEEKFYENNINCEVLNFGFGSKGLNFLEDLLVNEAVDYNPNIITIMSNRNATMYDSYGNSVTTPDVIKNKFDYIIYKTNKFLFSKIMTYRFLQLSYKRILSKFYSQENKIIDPYNPKNFHLKNYFTSKYINQMTNILNFCKSRGIMVIFIKQGFYIDPTYQKSLKLLPNEKIIEKLMVYNKESNRDKIDLFWIYTNLILNNALEKIKTENKDVIIVDPIDKLYSFKKEKNFLNDGLHLTSDGNEIIAAEIMKSIMKNIDLSAFSP
jgi:hypothetical protein